MNAQAEQTKTLLPHHRKDLHKSGLNDETIKAAGFYSATREEAKDLLEFDPSSGGLVTPYPHRNGLPELINFKPDTPLEGENGKKRKYLRPKGSQSRVYIPAITSMEAMQGKGLTLYIVEGEKKALKGAQEGLVCIALSGVWNWKYRDEMGDSRTIPDLRDVWLKGRKVAICFDSDISKNHMVALAEHKLAEKLGFLGAIVSGVRLPSGPNGEKVGLDDYLIGHSIEEFKALECVSLEEPPTLTVTEWIHSHEDSGQDEKPNIKEIIPVLAKMDPLDYDLVREKVAKLAGVRVGVLDREVNKIRPRQEEEKQAVTFENPIPYKDEINGGELLDEIVSWINKYLVMDKGTAEAVAAWCVASWCLHNLYFAPILSILSATKRSGKSTLLDLIKLIVYRGFLTMGAGITPAILFRTNEKYHPTFLIDEAEKLSGDEGAKELIGLLNAGHKKGGTVFRCDPNTFEPIPYDAFGFRAVAAIGTLWDTILDRSIVVRMTRKIKDAEVSRFSARQVEKEGKVLASKIARWVEDNRLAMAEAEEKTPRPESLNDRACDNWTALFAVGMVAESKWLDRLLESAKNLQPSSEDTEGRGEILIRDIQEIFEDRGNPEEILSVDLVDTLNLVETSPWGDYRKGKGVSTQWLAKNLKPFGIHPKHFRNGNGYRHDNFKDAFARYTPPVQPSHPSQTNKNNNLGGSQPSQKEEHLNSNLHSISIKNKYVTESVNPVKVRKGYPGVNGKNSERRAINL